MLVVSLCPKSEAKNERKEGTNEPQQNTLFIMGGKEKAQILRFLSLNGLEYTLRI